MMVDVNMKKDNNSVFSSRVLRVVSRIPRGVVMTYAEVAKKAGYPGSSRTVGSTLRKNKNSKIPCFRVVRSDGYPGMYNRGEIQKKRLLLKEGSLDNCGRVRRYFSFNSSISRDTVLQILRSGGVGILPTDTLYGLVGCALNIETVDRIYRLRRRRPDKPCIILISSIREMRLFDVHIPRKYSHIIRSIWPGPISSIFPCKQKKFTYLHRGKETLAFRIPDNNDLIEILKKTGPLLAPSANIEGELVSRTILEARKVFWDKVDFYVDGGYLYGRASTLIACEKDGIVLKRKGRVFLSKENMESMNEKVGV